MRNESRASLEIAENCADFITLSFIRLDKSLEKQLITHWKRIFIPLNVYIYTHRLSQFMLKQTKNRLTEWQHNGLFARAFIYIYICLFHLLYFPSSFASGRAPLCAFLMMINAQDATYNNKKRGTCKWQHMRRRRRQQATPIHLPSHVVADALIHSPTHELRLD